MSRWIIKQLLVFAVFDLFVTASASRNACYAPPLVYGGVCTGTGIFGSDGYILTYSIDQVNNAGTLLCCQVRGCGPIGGRSCTTFGFYDAGCSSSSIVVSVPWGNNAATTAIRCKGVATGTSVQWSP